MIPGKVSSVGVPHSLQITSSCCCSSFPGRKLREVINSINTHLEKHQRWIKEKDTYPTDQMSISGPYTSEPSRSSGARYHNVTTLLEKLGCDLHSTAVPRSAITRWPSLFSKRFAAVEERDERGRWLHLVIRPM